MQADQLAALGRDLCAAALLRGDFVLSSGRRSSYYFDKYLFETRPELLGPVGKALAARIPSGTEVLAAPELGAVALAAAMSLESGLPFVIVRREPKEYGTARFFEGSIAAGQNVLLVEDVVTTGGQALTAAGRLRRFGVHLDTCVCVLDREEGGLARFREFEIRLDSLFTTSSLEIN
ncbi:MAG: orotate phosphoribosyltransferase [Chloroflexi bacterium]|nr:orotate phosphoribosyltransferase [Chloroflexota bacterium]